MSAADTTTPVLPRTILSVHLNSADRAELERLPGIGPKKAAAILAVRQKLGGRFPRLRDLRRVKGIGKKTVERLKPYVILDLTPSTKGVH
jgi:competence protein ComEA